MTKRKVRALVLIFLAAVAAFLLWRKVRTPASQEQKTVAVQYGDIEQSVSATGNVQPQNRLEIKSPIAGRVEKIFVKEGEMIRAGQIVALLSSTERAALLDAARLQGAAQEEWEDVYKPTSLIAPIDAQVIVKSVNPGQTVTPSDPVVVLSDRLIVQAQVDETDIGKVKPGQGAAMSLDAYPDIKVGGIVDHIYYESKLVNNVTIYAVDIVPDQVPDVFRSGMSANVRIVQQRRQHVPFLPREALKKQGEETFVLLKEGGGKPQRRPVETGISDDENTEIISGLSEGDQVLLSSSSKYSPPAPRGGSSPFMPNRRGGNAR